MSTGNQMPTFNSFTIIQAFLGAPLQFQPALGSKELEELIDAYVVGNACKKDKLSSVTIDFYNHATVDINTGSLVRRYDVMPWALEQSPSQSQSSGLSPPTFTPSPASSATFPDSTYNSSISTPSNRTRGSRVTKKAKKDITKKSAEVRLPGFSIMTKDGIDVTNSVGRGTKTKEQREHAHLMRIIKACDECKRKKIRCDPSHRRSSHPDMSRASAPSKPSPPSQSNPSPAASTPSLSRETTQGSEQSSPPIDAFSIEDFVLFPEDDLNQCQWNPEMPVPGFDTQYSDFNMNNYNSFPELDTSFSTMNDNLSFDFPSFGSSSSFSSQPLNNTSHIPNYYNAQPFAHVDVNSQYISPTQSQQPDLDFFGSFGDLQDFSPTHTLHAHSNAVPDEDPGKNNGVIHSPGSRSQAHNVSSRLPTAIPQTGDEINLHDFSTPFSLSPTDSCYQSQGSEHGFANTGLGGAYDHATGSGTDSGVEQSPQSESSNSGLETVTSMEEGRSRSQRRKHQVLLERERERIDNHDRELANAFLSYNEESQVPGASAGQLVSGAGVGGVSRSTSIYRSFASGSSPVHEETPWSFESTLSSLSKSRPEILQNTVEGHQDDGVLHLVKPREGPDVLARSENSVAVHASLGRAVGLAGDHISSRLANFTTNVLDQQVSSAGSGLVPTQLAVSSSMSRSRSRFIVDLTPQVASGVFAPGALAASDRLGIISSPGFVLVDKSDSKVSSRYAVKTDSSECHSLDYNRVATVVDVVNTNDATVIDKPKAISAAAKSAYLPPVKSTTAPSKIALRTVSTLAALALGLAATVVLSRSLEISTMVLVLYLVACICCGSRTNISGQEKSFLNTFISASMWNFWSDMRFKMDCYGQRALKEKESRRQGINSNTSIKIPRSPITQMEVSLSRAFII